MNLSKEDCRNLLDALYEWLHIIGPKELQPAEVGLDAERYEEIMKRLQKSS